MKKISTVQVFGNEILTGQKLTIGANHRRVSAKKETAICER